MKNLSKFTLIVLMFLSLDSFSQESIIGEIKYSDLEKYIDLAVQNYPRLKITDINVEKAKTDISMNAISYLDIFNASYFYRPNNKTAIDVINPYAVNGFQFSVNLNLGNFLQKPLAGKKAKADYKIAKLEAEDFRLTLATEVKKRYYAYIQQINQLKIYTQSVQDNQNVADNLKNKFEKGEVALDTYNQSRINLTIASTSKIQTEVNLLSAKDALEEIIGMKLSEVK
ncbi:TolC family protein [Pedobacter panaciterrae]|jgi:Outer membrane protein|uniref:TolC family protein n=1 Tax=Pedobacter panaciterrae TaxID=363849 RepID=A0ABU8NF47_9SPHI|nr:TolC family protein [Pedobacter panaciterrae]NQX56529.1 TolC family protein [Pedobacter panaciterrae]